MKYFGEGLSEKHKKLSRILRKPTQFEQGQELFLEIHSKLHLSIVSGEDNEGGNEIDRLIGDLKESEYAIMPTVKDETIAWVLWHISRIEDLTMNILIADGEQIFNPDRQNRLHSPITDTGNALSDEQIMYLSKSICIEELIHYRNEVGKRTRKIISSLAPSDMRKAIPAKRIDRILQEGGVTLEKESLGLLDFWVKKDVAGILLMPPTRHIMLHLNDCCKWKLAIRSRRKFYKT